MRKKLFAINYIMLFFIMFIYSFSKYIFRLNNLAFYIILGVVFAITLFWFLIQIIMFVYFFTGRGFFEIILISLLIGGYMVVYLRGFFLQSLD